MQGIKKLVAIAAVLVAVGAGLTACSDSDVVSQNISTDAEQFKIHRQIVFYNGVTDKYIVEVDGYCSVDKADSGLPAGTLNVTCKIGKDKYFKDSLGLADNTPWFSLQTKASKSDPYHYEIIWKPSVLLPNIVAP